MEQGTHKELMERKGQYYKRWEMQQGNFVIRKEEEEVAVTKDFSEEDVISYT